MVYIGWEKSADFDTWFVENLFSYLSKSLFSRSSRWCISEFLQQKTSQVEISFVAIQQTVDTERDMAGGWCGLLHTHRVVCCCVVHLATASIVAICSVFYVKCVRWISTMCCAKTLSQFYCRCYCFCVRVFIGKGCCCLEQVMYLSVDARWYNRT